MQNFIKKNFEKYEQLDDVKWSSANIIAGDTSFASVAAQLVRNNAMWESEKNLQRSLSSEQLNADLAFLKESLQKMHPGIYWYSDKKTIDGQFESVRQKINKGVTRKEFFLLLGPLIEKIHCGHTELLPLTSSEASDLSTPLFPLN